MLYIHTEDIHNLVAPREVVPIILDLVHPQNVLDIGCGTGTWLKAFEECGISDYRGVDGAFVDKSLLKIPETKFTAADLCNAWSLDRKFDLTLCLEVAEHLPEECADRFVETVAIHSNTILFSAAIPAQGGQKHLNEQWPEYWQAKFSKHGFYFHDVIRPVIWDNSKIDWWYRQNIFLVTKAPGSMEPIRKVVHPELMVQVAKRKDQFIDDIIKGKQGLRLAIRILLNSLVFKIKALIGSSSSSHQ